MAGKQLSYDYQNDKRDLGDVFEQIIKSRPVLTNIFSVGGKATNTKHEWLEDIVAPKSWTLNAGYTAADGLMTLVSTTGIKVGDVLQFEKTTGARSTFNAIVTTVTSSTEIAISTYGSTTDEDLASGAIVTLLGRPKNESTEASADNGYEPTTAYNYTQIMDRTAKVSLTSIEIPKYGIGGALNYQVERQLTDIAYELANTAINMPRVERDSSNAGTMGGFMRFLKQGTGNVVDASSAALSQTILNNAFEVARANGADNLTTIACHPLQARKISAFNTTGDNPMIMRDETVAGSYVTRYVSDQGDVVNIVADRNFNKDEVAIIDPTKITLVPMRRFQDKDATPAGADYVARRIIGEYTLEVKNASNSHVYIKDLAI